MSGGGLGGPECPAAVPRVFEVRALVVLPTYQEAPNIVAVLERLRLEAPKVDVLVVDDGSPDGTADLAEEAAARLQQIVVLRRPGKSGLGQAYKAGFAVALEQGYDAVVEMDADLSHDPAAVPSLLSALDQEGADLAVGARYVPGGAIPAWSWHRAALSRWGNRYAAVVLGLEVHDATSGFRAYRTAMLADLALEDVRADGYGFQIEMVYRITRARGRVVEVPITFVDRTAGTSKMSGRIVVEALLLVTAWGVRDRVRWLLDRARGRRVGSAAGR